jgi:FtsP/CotA-like multicopper oxidase with cupredoxin domain
MAKTSFTDKSFSRRRFAKLFAGTGVAMAGLGWLPAPFKKMLGPVGLSEAYAQSAYPAPDLYFAGTDGWISLPPSPQLVSPALGLVHPDVLAPQPPDGPPGLTTYIFGFRNVTDLSDSQRANQKSRAQHNAPMFWVDQFDPGAPKDFRMQLTNLGLALRPDLFDAHTIHWHGFRNVITFFDGEPTGSVAVTAGRTFQYIYRPRDPGTYMFHCHVEDVEHVHMGMTGPVFVRPLQNGQLFGGFTKFAYNDGDGSTGYHREFAMFCSEVWCDSHWADAHIQLPEWSDYKADFSLLNGRVYPDTLAPNAPLAMPASAATAALLHTLPVQTDASGALLANPDYAHLQNQPLSALVTCNAGERVLLRFANLGFRESAMTLAGIKMRVVGKDATPMRGRDGTDTSYEASTLSFGAGESIDAVFTAPPYAGGRTASGVAADVYVLYDRAYERANNLAFGGRKTEIWVYPAGALPAQLLPNT